VVWYLPLKRVPQPTLEPGAGLQAGFMKTALGVPGPLAMAERAGGDGAGILGVDDRPVHDVTSASLT
jgi:hypothetical protein